jgi:hypothetical protein
LNFSAFAENAVITSSTTESNKSYDDSDPTLSALNVSGEGITYNGTGITLSVTSDGATDTQFGKGAYVKDGAILSLTGGTITTTGSYGIGVYLIGASSGTLDNVNIQTGNYQSYGAYANGSTLVVTGGSITTGGSNGYGVVLYMSSGTVNNVNVTTTGERGYGVNVQNNSTLEMAGVNITTSGSIGYGLWINDSSGGTVSNANIETTKALGHGVYVQANSTLTLTDSDIRTTGSGAFGLYLTGSSTATVQLNGNTLSSTGINSHSILAASSTVTLTGSNGSVITGNVWIQGSSRLDLTLTGADTELHGNFRQSNATSVINLTLDAGALFEGSGELDSLTLGNGVTIGYTGAAITVTDSITIDGTVTIDLSNLTATGDYDILDWSGATGNVNVGNANYNFTGAGVEGDFEVKDGQLVFNATAVPEPSTWFLLGAGLGLLLLAARYRHRQARTDA